jgi:hypothetical protein
MTLADPRLAGCAPEYHAALNHMRGGTAKDQEVVIDESGKAVESALNVLLGERGVTLTGKETAFPLFKLLVDNGICPQEADNAVLGVARIRKQSRRARDRLAATGAADWSPGACRQLRGDRNQVSR